MNRTKDGYHSQNNAAGARKRRTGVQGKAWSFVCIIAAMTLVRMFAAPLSVCAEDATPHAVANQAMRLVDSEPRELEMPAPTGRASANSIIALTDELEPIPAEMMCLKSYEEVVVVGDTHCEMRELEALLASAGYGTFDYDAVRAASPDENPSRGAFVMVMTEVGDEGEAEPATDTEEIAEAAGVDEGPRPGSSAILPMRETTPAAAPELLCIKSGEDEVVAVRKMYSELQELQALLASTGYGTFDDDSSRMVSLHEEMGPPCEGAAEEKVSQESSPVLPMREITVAAGPAFYSGVVTCMNGLLAPSDENGNSGSSKMAIVPTIKEEDTVETTEAERNENEAKDENPPQENSSPLPMKEITTASAPALYNDVVTGIHNLFALPEGKVGGNSSETMMEEAVQQDDTEEATESEKVDGEADAKAEVEAEANEEAEAETEAEADEEQPQPSSPALPMKETMIAAPPKPNGDMIASVSILSEDARRITVGKNSSAAIDLKMNCDRAEIADPTIADIVVISPTRIIVSGKTFGTTQMILRVGEQQKVFNVSVEHDMSLLANVIRSLSPTANVMPRSINGTIVLVGTVPDSQTGDRIAEMASLFQGGQVRNQLTVAGVQQTMLRVVVAEVNKEAVRQLGFNWAIGGGDWSRDFFFANNVGGLNPTVFSSGGSPNIGADPTPQILYSVAPNGNGAATNLTFGFPRAEFQVFMQALRQNALARVLAEPNLVAISGQTATFLAGGEVPIPVTQGGAVAGSITIEYKEFGVRLAFTPTVLAGQIIRLHVMSEVSDAIPGDTIAGGLPVFSFVTRRVESTIECGNGQTFAMAGLLNEQIQAVARKIPGLGDMPVLGALFSSVEYQKNNTELVVLVTPQLVEPLDPQQVPPPPGALMTAPTDLELFSMGQLEGVPNEAPVYEGVPREQAPVNTPPPRSTSTGSYAPVALQGPWGLAHSDEN